MDIVTILTINGFSMLTGISTAIITIALTKVTQIISFYDTGPEPEDDTAQQGSSSNPLDPSVDPSSGSDPTFTP